MSKTYQQSLIRFLFIFIVFFIEQGFSADLSNIYNEHFYPVVDRARGIKSSKILMVGSILSIASYNERYDLPKATSSQIKLGESLGNGALSLGLIGAQILFDDELYNYQSHLRGLIYTTVFVFSAKAILSGYLPGSNIEYQPFPSTHTAIAFMSATSLTYAYGWPAAIIAYPVASFVGYSKLGSESTRLSDILVGATIGVWLGRATYYEDADRSRDLRLQKNIKLTSLNVIPIITSQNIGTILTYSF